jgi:lipopolysaccharide export LptBFGC system permease protein LptF
MIFWIGFFVMFCNEGFVMMRHVSPWFGRQRDKFINKYGANVWYRFHGTLDYVWMILVGLGLILYPNRLFHIAVLATFWGASFLIFYLPRWIKNGRSHN